MVRLLKKANLPPLYVLLSVQRDARAQYDLGYKYDTGSVLVQDYAQAMFWYRKAADQGYARAQYNLARMYAQGHGVPANPAEAAIWYRNAAVCLSPV